ncbi:MAG: GNAT family N-acetyltransferase [Candidatus Aenigmarchaeota archaeon]|nr:GNAT family N-acetyltransferase [Candidatus Aenigmarchaeota archaeon]
MDLAELTEQYNAYIFTQKKNLGSLSMDNIPFEIEPIEAMSPKNASWYEKEIGDLNYRVFGPMGLGSKAWVDIHFGGMAGATVGLKKKNGPVISMARFVGHIDTSKLQLWTLMVSPGHQSRGIGKATLALVCALNRNKKKISYITQIEDDAILLYLKMGLENPVKLIGIGFYHSQMPNSIGLETKIPSDPWKTFFSDREQKKLENAKLLDDIDNLKEAKNPILISPKSKKINELGDALAEGDRYEIIEWFSQSSARKLFGIEEPLLAIKRVL